MRRTSGPTHHDATKVAEQRHAIASGFSPRSTQRRNQKVAERRQASNADKTTHLSSLRDSSSRRAFSLIEVILATAILLASVVVLGELAGIGRRQSQRADLQSQAQELCERTLNEILIGEREAIEVDSEPLLPPDSEQTDITDLGEQLIDEDEELLIFETPEEQALLSTGGELSESDWLYSVRIMPLTDMPGLVALTVSVRQSDEQLQRPVRFSLTRWLEAPASLSEDITGSDPFEPTTSGFGGRR